MLFLLLCVDGVGVVVFEIDIFIIISGICFHSTSASHYMYVINNFSLTRIG